MAEEWETRRKAVALGPLQKREHLHAFYKQQVRRVGEQPGNTALQTGSEERFRRWVGRTSAGPPCLAGQSKMIGKWLQKHWGSWEQSWELGARVCRRVVV